MTNYLECEPFLDDLKNPLDQSRNVQHIVSYQTPVTIALHTINEHNEIDPPVFTTRMLLAETQSFSGEDLVDQFICPCENCNNEVAVFYCETNEDRTHAMYIMVNVDYVQSSSLITYTKKLSRNNNM